MARNIVAGPAIVAVRAEDTRQVNTYAIPISVKRRRDTRVKIKLKSLRGRKDIVQTKEIPIADMKNSNK